MNGMTMTNMTPEEFEEIYKQNSHLNWNYDFLSECSYISWPIVRFNLQKPWNLKKLSANPIITWEIVEDTPFLRWDWEGLSQNPSMTFDIILRNCRHMWDLDILAQRFSEEQMDLFYKERDSYIDNNSLEFSFTESDYDDGYDSYS